MFGPRLRMVATTNSRLHIYVNYRSLRLPPSIVTNKKVHPPDQSACAHFVQMRGSNRDNRRKARDFFDMLA